MKTILIKGIDCEEISNDREFMKLYHQPKGFPCHWDDDSGLLSIETETIRFREFYDANKNRLRIGMSKEVQDVLGLQYKSVDALMARSEDLERFSAELDRKLEVSVREVDSLRDGIQLIESAPFLTRLRWLFTGVK